MQSIESSVKFMPFVFVFSLSQSYIFYCLFVKPFSLSILLVPEVLPNGADFFSIYFPKLLSITIKVPIKLSVY